MESSPSYLIRRTSTSYYRGVDRKGGKGRRGRRGGSLQIDASARLLCCSMSAAWDHAAHGLHQENRGSPDSQLIPADWGILAELAFRILPRTLAPSWLTAIACGGCNCCSGINPSTMTSLAEVFQYRERTPNLPTYSAREGGIRFAYQVSIAVSLSLDDARQRRLESHFNQEQGYESCECNRNRNVVTIYRMDGIRRSDVMKYIRRRVDPNARELSIT